MDILKISQRLERESTHYPVKLPAGKSGKWRIGSYKPDHRSVMLENVRHVLDMMPESVVSPDIRYTVLYGPCGERGTEAVMMSNTQLEYRTNRSFVESAHGDVLVVGLGIGMLIRPLAERKEVKTITVLEKEPDVIALVKPHYRDVEKLRVYEADAFDFEPDDLMGQRPDRWDSVMIDIWPSIGPDNLPDMKKLHGRYAQWVNKGGKVHCWAQDLCRRMKRIEARMEYVL